MNFFNILDQFSDSVLDSGLVTMTNLGVSLAAILCGFVLLRNVNDYIENNVQGWWQILKPLVILFVVSMFSTVVGGFNSVVGVFGREIAAQVDVDFKDYEELVSTRVGGMGKTSSQVLIEMSDELSQDKPKSKIWASVRAFFTGVKYFFISKWKTASDGILIVVFSICVLAGKIIMFVIHIFSKLYLVMLSLFGPIIFALAILPSFESGIRNWIARYIQIWLWTPASYVVIWVGYLLMKCVPSGATIMSDIGNSYLCLILYLIDMMLMLNVPKFCGMIVESAGTGGLHDRASNLLNNVLKKR